MRSSRRHRAPTLRIFEKLPTRKHALGSESFERGGGEKKCHATRCDDHSFKKIFHPTPPHHTPYVGSTQRNRYGSVASLAAALPSRRGRRRSRSELPGMRRESFDSSRQMSAVLRANRNTRAKEKRRESSNLK